MVNGWIRNIQERLFPPTCLLCGDRGMAGMDLCEGCHGDLPYLTSGCDRCAMPLPGAGRCGQCQRRPPPVERAYGVFHYAPPFDHLMRALKFRDDLRVARLLGSLMATYLAGRVDRPPQRLIPVPLHASRLRERGYNQALELARPLAAQLNIPLDYASCRRTRATPAQSLLSVDQRRRNLRGAFDVAAALRATHVAVVDDVMTTGSTVNELARSLRGAGVKTIEIWVCGRATPNVGP